MGSTKGNSRQFSRANVLEITTSEQIFREELDLSEKKHKLVRLKKESMRCRVSEGEKLPVVEGAVLSLLRWNQVQMKKCRRLQGSRSSWTRKELERSC